MGKPDVRILGRAAGNVADGGTENPPCNRKGRAGNPPPKGARASALPDIESWLDAGVMQDGKWTDTGLGTPQGANVSPVLANVFLHYVLDLWFQRRWRPNVPGGEAVIVRYADDFVVGFQSKEDAERFLEDLKERLAEFGLDLHPEKNWWSSEGSGSEPGAPRAGQAGDL